MKNANKKHIKRIKTKKTRMKHSKKTKAKKTAFFTSLGITQRNEAQVFATNS